MINKDKIINRIFKVLCVYEQTPENYLNYLDTVIVELLGYSTDEHFTQLQHQQFYDASVALRGLKQLEDNTTIHHKIVRRTILRYVNKLAEVL